MYTALIQQKILTNKWQDFLGIFHDITPNFFEHDSVLLGTTYNTCNPQSMTETGSVN